MEEQITAVIEPSFLLGPMKAHLPNSMVAYLNDFCVRESDEAEDYSPYLAGKITSGKQLGFLPDKLDSNIREMITKLSQQYLYQLSGDESHAKRPLEIEKLWLVEQHANDFNPAHQHGGLLAGIIYLQVPPQCSLETKEGCIDFLFGRYSVDTADFCGQRTVLPVAGDMYIFPAWLQHVVYPFKGEGKRVCLPFNVIHSK